MIRTLLILLLFTFSVPLWAQSTLGSISGVVTDSSGAVIPRANVYLHRQESGTDNTVEADSAGNYTAQSLQPGHYDVRVTAKGLATTKTGVTLDTRQQLRLDVVLTVGATTQEVTVSAGAAGVINSENAQVSAVLTPEAVLNLPANYRGAGSTSPLSVVQALPGVQPDSGNSPPTPSTHPSPSVRYSIQGGLPSQTETTVDGISAQNQTNNNVQADALPSAESIAEIRVDGVSNNAEYGQPGEITTVTKSGTNKVHGSAYLYVQNDALNATPFGVVKPQVNAKDFGASVGAPLMLGHLYQGRDKTFIFGAYEGLRFPQTVPLLNPSGGGVIVPTQLMRMGDFSQEDAGTTLQNPLTGGNFKGTNNKIPVNPVSAQFLQFWPAPNINQNLSTAQAAAATNCHCNYQANRQNNINSDQFDVRVDHTISSKASAFVRYSWKNNNQTQYADLTLPNSNAFAQYRVLSSSLNYAVSPHFVNEFQFGFTLEQDGNANPYNGLGFTQGTGLQVGVTPFFNGLPHIMFNDGLANVYPIGERLGFDERSRVFQYLDTLTYTRGSHVLRAGFDVRHLLAHTEAGGDTLSINYGNFSFDQAYSATGDQFADFLLGVPYQNQSNNIRSDNDASANSYAFFTQDTWKITKKLNLSYGMRYEFHPALASSNGLAGNFSPLGRTGQLIYPAGYASSLDTEELANVNACPTAGINNSYATGHAISGIGCTPVVSNTQAGLPAGLRTAPKTRFEPRFGFAYRPFDNDRTVVRGGAGYFNITTSGALYYALEQTLQQNFQTFSNSYSSGANTAGSATFVAPTFVFPNTSASGQFTPALGSVYFYAAVDPQWRDPYSLQQDLSIDHDFGRNFGGRISYIGMHTWHQVWQPQFNQLPRSSTRQASQAAATDYPFPNFYQITRRSPGAAADYQSMQLEFTRRQSHGFSLDSVYTLAKNLSDNQGTNGNYSSPAGFVDEQGGYNPTDSTDAKIDYGNVAGTRHQRWLTTAIYQLPFGSGKRFGTKSNVANALLGGWQLSNIFLVQSGPWLTAYFPAGDIDPSGTGSGTYVGGANQRPDIIGNANAGAHQRSAWFNKNAFACPGSTSAGSVATCSVGTGTSANGAAVLPIGRFGTESIGSLRGPGTINLSAGLSKSVEIYGRLRVRAEATFTNVLNHTNLADPSLDLTSATFNTITTARGSDFGGNRTGQVSVRLEY